MSDRSGKYYHYMYRGACTRGSSTYYHAYNIFSFDHLRSQLLDTLVYVGNLLLSTSKGFLDPVRTMYPPCISPCKWQLGGIDMRNTIQAL